MSTPGGDRMKALAKMSKASSDAFAALQQEGYGGGSDVPMGGDSPESAAQILGKAASFVICHYATKYPPDKQNKLSVYPKILTPLKAVYFAVEGDVNIQEVNEAFYKLIKTEGKWETLSETRGFVGGAWENGLNRVIDRTTGGINEDQREAFAVACMAVFAARWAVQETKFFPGYASYVGIFTYLNEYFRAFGEDADPDGWPVLNISGGALANLLRDNYKPIFQEIAFTSDKTSPSKVTMFGFEDLNEIFKEPVEPQLMKDSELQTYMINGEIHYDKWWWYEHELCRDTHVPIQNPKGIVTGYINIGPTVFPCVDESKNVVPITGTSFQRTFVEAPPVSGTYDEFNTKFITEKTQINYPYVAYYGDKFTFLEYLDVNNRWLTRYTEPGTNSSNHYVSDASNYEPYYFINNHETNAGNPWPGGCSFPQGYCSSAFWGGYHPNIYDAESCVTVGEGLGKTWEWITDDCLSHAPATSSPFPGQGEGWLGFGENFEFTRDMSLRHNRLRENRDKSVEYWDDMSQIEWTGYVMCPLTFSALRFESLYKDHKLNPIPPSLDNLGRRAFSYAWASTANVVPGTCGPPQSYGDPFKANVEYNYDGGPFVYAQVHAENRTKNQRASINLFPGWCYRHYIRDYGEWDHHRTGGWNLPLIRKTYANNWTDPLDISLSPSIDFYGTKISNNFNVDGVRELTYCGMGVGYCSDTDYTTKAACEEAGTCDGNWSDNQEDCEEYGGVWTSDGHTWTEPSQGYFFGTGVYPSDSFCLDPQYTTKEACEAADATWKAKHPLAGQRFSGNADVTCPYNGRNQISKKWDVYDPSMPDPFHPSQEIITPAKFFGMGDGCQDIPVTSSFHRNAGTVFSFHEIDHENVTHPYLKTLTGGMKEFNDAGYGAELFFTNHIIGQYGENYWDEYVTGWINTGHFAGETVHCMHKNTGYAVGLAQTRAVEYYWLGSGINDVHFDFPYYSIDCLVNHGPLSPYPNLNQCCVLYPGDETFIGIEPPPPTTTTTVNPNTTTTTTCDPMDPECGEWATTTTTTTEDPTFMFCEETYSGYHVISCPSGHRWDDVDGYVNALSVGDPGYIDGHPLEASICSWEQCMTAGCVYDDSQLGYIGYAWASGVWPGPWVSNPGTNEATFYGGRHWVEQIVKQRNENPPRYWHGPYASTHFTFMYDNAGSAFSTHYPEEHREEYPISGFPHKMLFTVEIEEFIVRDFASGGYINENAEITWDEKLIAEMGGDMPEYKTENTGYNWGNLVDGSFVGDPTAVVCGGKYGCAGAGAPGDETFHHVILDWSTANGRNIERYSGETDFDRGNQYTPGKIYGYGTNEDNAINSRMQFFQGGYHHYSGYSFPIEATYVHPTYDLKTHKTDYSSMIAAWEVGNFLYFKCGAPYQNEYIGPVHGEVQYGSVDPVYFMPTQSNDMITGTFDRAPWHGTNPETFTGSFIHQKQIYGDHWMGLRAQSLYTTYTYMIESGLYSNGGLWSSVAGDPGDLIMCSTGQDGSHNVANNTGYDAQAVFDYMHDLQVEHGMDGGSSDDWEFYFCDIYPEFYGQCEHMEPGAPGERYPESWTVEKTNCLAQNPRHDNGEAIMRCDNKVWLFNVGASGVGVHVRAPSYISGYKANSALDHLSSRSMGNDWGPGVIPTPADQSENPMQGIDDPMTAALGFEITGTNTIVKNVLDDNPASPTYGEYIKGVGAGPDSEPIDWFKRDWLDDREIHAERIVYEKWGVLFENPSGAPGASDYYPDPERPEWHTTSTGYETILQHGSRLFAASDGDVKVRVSGYAETSKLVITIKDIMLHNYGEVPSHSYWSMESSGNCMVTGNMSYLHQSEASIYTEGIVLEDKSDDSLRDVLDYPHYASEVIKRDGVILPTGDFQMGIYDPDFENQIKQIKAAPSKMIMRTNEFVTAGTGMHNYHELLKGAPYYYNRYIWPTRSDMSQWNAGELSWEGPPTFDNSIYPVNELMISAQVGQPTASTNESEFIERNFSTTQHIGFYDSVCVDPTINREWWRNLDLKHAYQPNSSYMVPEGTTVNDIKQGVVLAKKNVMYKGMGDGSSVAGYEGDVVGILT